MKSILSSFRESYNNAISGRISGEMLANTLIGIFLFFCVCFSKSAMCGYLSLFFFGLFIIHILFNYTIILFKYLHYFFACAASIVGCAIIEYTEIYLYEIGEMSSYVGALPLLTISWWAFFVTLRIHDSWIVKRQKKQGNLRNPDIVDYFSVDNRNKNLIAYAAALIGSLFIIYVFFVVLRNPAFILGVDRFRYVDMFDYGALYDQALRGLKYLIIPIIVVAVYKHSIIGWLAIGVFCLYSFWIGNKFGSFFSLLCIGTMIFSQRIAESEKISKRKIALVMVIIAVLIGVAVFGVSFTHNEARSQYLFSRIAQQGQLWWKTYDKSDEIHFSEIGDEIDSIKGVNHDINQNIGSKHGIYKVMYYTAPRQIVDNKLMTGSAYTEAGLAAAYYYLGVPGCLFFVVIGAVLSSFFVNSFLFHLRYNQYVRAFIHYRFYSSIHVFVSAFTLYPFFNKTSILSYIILLICYKKVFKIGGFQI